MHSAIILLVWAHENFSWQHKGEEDGNAPVIVLQVSVLHPNRHVVKEAKALRLDVVGSACATAVVARGPNGTDGTDMMSMWL